MPTLPEVLMTTPLVEGGIEPTGPATSLTLVPSNLRSALPKKLNWVMRERKEMKVMNWMKLRKVTKANPRIKTQKHNRTSRWR